MGFSKEILIVGAGKIGRGFIGRLFYRSGFRLWFVDVSPGLVDRMNSEKKYRVDIAREGTDVTEYIHLAGAFTPEREKEIQPDPLMPGRQMNSPSGTDRIKKLKTAYQLLSFTRVYLFDQSPDKTRKLVHLKISDYLISTNLRICLCEPDFTLHI